MNLLYAREPVSAWSHAAWLLLSIPGAIWLWKLSRDDWNKRVGLMIFAASLSFCYMSSALYHGLRLSKNEIEDLNLIDHGGIYIFIAGSYTPIATTLVQGRWRRILLDVPWFFAATGCTLLILHGELDPIVNTVLYLVMGWGAILCLFELSRVLPARSLGWLVAGGVFYSVGAVVNLLKWPVILPGVFGAHDLFHFLVMAGTLAHFLFMIKVVVPYEKMSPRPNAFVQENT